MDGCVATHWRIKTLSVATSSKENDSLSFKKLSCANGPPYYAAILADLIMYQPYSRDHSYCKFMTVDHVMFRKQNLTVLFSSLGS